MRIQVDPQRVATTFAGFTDHPALQESAQLFAQGRPMAEMVQALAMSGNALRAFAGFGNIYPNGSLERGVLEKVILRVSQLHECQFCTASHLDIMKGLGIGTDLSPAASATTRERLAVDYAERITRDSNRIPDAFFAELRAAFTDAEIVELTLHTGFITLLNRFNNALQVRYHGDFDTVEIR